MSINEFINWGIWFEMKAEAEEKAYKEAEKKAKHSKGRR